MNGDQHWQTYQPGDGSEPGEPTDPPLPPTHVEPGKVTTPYSSSIGTGRGPRGGGVLVLLLFVVLPVVLVGGIATAVFVGSGSDGVPGLGKPDALSADGLDQLRSDIEDRSGDTVVFGATIYPEYAVVDVPIDGSSRREESLYWDGDLSDFAGKGTSTDSRVDLADVDAEVMVGAVETARSLVEDPDTWYVIVDGPSENAGDEDDVPTLTAYATNDFSETAFVELGFDGTEIRRIVPE